MNNKTFIKIPVKYDTSGNTLSTSEVDDCEECFEKAENLGVSVSKLCPQCFSNKDTDEDLDLIESYIDVKDITEYFPIENGLKTRIFVASSFAYVDAYIVFSEFLEKIKKSVEII